MNRRDFLSSALAAPLMADQGAERIRIAFLGAAHLHAAPKLEVVRANPRFELVGLAEDDPALRAKYEKAGIRLLGRADVLGDSSIPAVAVESAVKDHARDGQAALEAGKHIHLEKPPSADLKAFRHMVSIAARGRRVLQLGYMWRYNPGINAALEVARKGWLGDVFMVRGTMNTLIGAEERLGLAEFRGGHMFELGGHLIDPMVRLLGAPSKVTSTLKHHGKFADSLADNNVAVLEFPKALGMVVISSLQPGSNRHRAFEIFGSNGNAVVRPIEEPVLQIDLAEAVGPYRVGIQRVELPPYRRYVDDFNALADAILLGRPLPVTPAEDLRVHRALLAASAMA